MEPIDPSLRTAVEREAERLCEVMNELDRLERLTGRPVSASEVAQALGWSVVDLAEHALNDAVDIGCASLDASGRYRLG